MHVESANFRSGANGLARLIAVIVFAASPFVFSAAAGATGTPAGTTITNQATATYDDPNASSTVLNSTSNAISIKVAEVAGITAVPKGSPTVVGGGTTVLPGNTVDFDYVITNTGNSANAFSIPNVATISGTANATLSGPLQISYDGGTTFYPFTDPNPAHAGTYNAGTARLQTLPVAAVTGPGTGSVIVRAVVAVPYSAGAAATINVLLGNTGPNDQSPATQNQPYNTPAHTGQIDTVNDATEVAPGPPVNGQREASTTNGATLGTTPLALVQLLKTGATATVNSNPQLDTIAYSLTLNVLASYSSISSAYTPAALAPTGINVGGASVARVLVSDVIPANTVLTSVATPPNGWTVVYSTDATSLATAAQFTTTPPALATVTRIGWVNPLAVGVGTSTAGFNYVVTSTGASTTATTKIYNIAQAYGQTQGDPTNALVYDQSGTQAPSNFTLGNGTPGSSVPTGNAPANGVAVVAGPQDPGNNTGVGGGANNIVTLSPQAAILNGPSGQSGAIGPDGTTNTDVTNQSIVIPPNLSPSAPLPTALSSAFTNTVSNPGTVPLSNMTLVPAPPAVLTALPAGTVVTISYPGIATTATYTYNGTAWTLTAGAVITVPSFAAGATQNYTVAITLPAGTPQSINGGAAAAGFPVPIVATGTTPFGTSTNLTIDTVFTGFLKLAKLAQTFNANGTPCDATPTLTPTPACVIPGNFVQYTIAYSNIAPTLSGSGNVNLTAAAVIIVEDGQAPPNTFASVIGGVLLTSHVQGSASDTRAANAITYFNGAGANVGDIAGLGSLTGDVTRYVDTFAAPLLPQQSGTFTFRRKIN